MTKRLELIVLSAFLVLLSGVGLTVRSQRCSGFESSVCESRFCAEQKLVEVGYQALWVAGDPGRAELCFKAAVHRNPASAYRWADLGEASLEGGAVDRARGFFRRAIELAPESPPIQMRMANFLIRTGQEREALPVLRGVLAKTQAEWEVQVLNVYRRIGLPWDEILARGMPDQPVVAQSLLRLLMRVGAEEEARQTWEWMAARRYTQDQIAFEYANFVASRKGKPE